MLADDKFMPGMPKYDGYQRGLASIVYTFSIKNQKEVVLRMKLKKVNNWLMNFINQLLGNLKKVKCILLLKTIFEMLI